MVGFRSGLGSAAAVASLLLLTGAAKADPAPAFAITSVRVFDGDKVLPKATVVVQAGKVTAIGASREGSWPAVKVVDGAGKTLLPGLIDAHTHTFGDARANALRFGVTTELDMFTYPGGLRAQLQQRDGMGQTKSADLFSAGVLATPPKGHGTEYGFPIPTLTTPAEAEAWVTARLAEGSDYIKLVYEPHMEGRRDIPSLDKATLKALVDSAHAHGKLAVAHISTLEGSRDAIEVGVDGLMHAFADKPGDAAFYRLAAQHKVFVVPTLGVISGITGSGEGAMLAADPRIAPFLSSAEAAELKVAVRGSPAYKLAVAQGEVAALRAAKVDILAGTDAGNPTTTHGASLHEEMALLVQAGADPGRGPARGDRRDAGAALQPGRPWAHRGRRSGRPGAGRGRSDPRHRGHARHRGDLEERLSRRPSRAPGRRPRRPPRRWAASWATSRPGSAGRRPTPGSRPPTPSAAGPPRRRSRGSRRGPGRARAPCTPRASFGPANSPGPASNSPSRRASRRRATWPGPRPWFSACGVTRRAAGPWCSTCRPWCRTSAAFR